MNAIEARAGNFRSLLELRGQYAGRRCFIIGNGPSLRAGDLDRLQAQGELSLGCNKVFLIFPQTHWRPTFYLIGDTGIAQSSSREIGESFVQNVLYADYLETHIPPPARFASFQVRENRQPKAPGFSENLAWGVFRGGTITYTALQVAHWLGIAEVYLLGVDFNYVLPELRPSQEFPNYKTYTPGTERNYFIEGYVRPNEVVVAPDLDTSLCAYQAAKRKAEASPAFKIFNATRGGKLDVFPRVGFDDLFPQLACRPTP
jgi:hypothetical protein